MHTKNLILTHLAALGMLAALQAAACPVGPPGDPECPNLKLAALDLRHARTMKAGAAGLRRAFVPDPNEDRWVASGGQAAAVPGDSLIPALKPSATLSQGMPKLIAVKWLPFAALVGGLAAAVGAGMAVWNTRRRPRNEHLYYTPR